MPDLCIMIKIQRYDAKFSSCVAEAWLDTSSGVSSFFIDNYIVIILITTVQNSPAAGDKALTGDTVRVKRAAVKAVKQPR